jgi:hypothetical protein
MKSSGAGVILTRDSPDQTGFPGNSPLWDTADYNPAFQLRQLMATGTKN